MSLETYHELEVYNKEMYRLDDNSPEFTAIQYHIKKIHEYDNIFDSGFRDDADDDLPFRKVSELNPEMYILIRGDIKDVNDVWKKVYFGGKLVASWELNTKEPYLSDMLSDDNCIR